MAVAVEVTFQGDGATLENYLKTLEGMGTGPEGTHPDSGCLFHWVESTDDGLRVTDVWMEREQFENFAENQIGPRGAEAGMPQPQVKFIEVENYLTAG
jgi:hypothetical protein